ncbi:MAG: divalent metal cation transporter [Acidobacteria bacterium]|nr:divalent metal cation transporter [Acidobacteriota bacterium]
MSTSDETQPSGLQKLFRLAASVAPGIFMIGYVIGTGSVTTMATAGADYGMSLTWTLVLASLFTHIMVVALSRLTILTGETTLFTFRNHFGKPVTIFLIGSLMVTQLASIIGVMAIVSDVMREWTAQVTGGPGIPQIVWAAGFTLLLLGLYWQGRHGFFLKVLALLVTMMGVAFFVTAFMVKPDPAMIIEGLLPSIPDVGNPALLIAGMIGTTMAGVVLVTRSVLVQEKGWTTNDFHEVNRDSGFSMTLLFFINAAIMACAAGTLHIRGMEIERAIDMVRTIEPLAGAAAAALFVFGILAAGLSSLFPNYLLGPWLISDFLGIKRDMSRPAFRILVVSTSLFGLIVPIFGGSPVQIMIASQALSPLVMPLLVLFVWILINKQSVAREHKPSVLLNIGMGVTLVFSTYMLYLAVVGFINRG